MEKISDKDLLGIYGHVIALVYSLNSGFFNNSVIGLTGEWGNGKSTMMNLIEKLISDKYKDDYETIQINPWEYNDDIDFFDILLKKSLILISKKEKIKNFLKIVYIIICILWILFVFLYIIYNLFFQKESLNSMLELFKNIGILLSPLWVYLGYIYIKTDSGFIKKYLGVGEKKERFSNIIMKYTKKGKKIIFLVDDLDRCSPKQVENILKIIVLFGNQDNCIFILGFDENIIIENLKKALDLKDIADDEKIKAYIEKIVHLQIPIPQIEKNDVSNYIDSKLKKGVDFNIENINLSLDYLEGKKNFIDEQFKKEEFKNGLFKMISSKTPRGINTGYGTVYYNFIYLLILEYYGYFDKIDIEILLKTSILKQLYGNIFNYLLLLENFEEIFTTIFYILNYENTIKNILDKKELKKLKEKHYLDSFIEAIENVFYKRNEIDIKKQKTKFQERLEYVKQEKNKKNLIIQDLQDKLEDQNLLKEKRKKLRNKIKDSKSIKDLILLKFELENKILDKDKKEDLWNQIRGLEIERNKLLYEEKDLKNFDKNYKKLFDICNNLISEKKNIRNIFPKNEKCEYFLNGILLGEYYKKSSLYNIFSNKDEDDLESSLNTLKNYYNPPKLNDILLIKITNSLENKNISDFKDGINIYLNIDKKKSCQKAIYLLNNSIFVKNNKVDELLNILEINDKILFGKLLNKLLDDIEYYFFLKRNINNNLEKMLISFSKILDLSEISNDSKKINLFKIDLMKKYVRIILQLNLQYRIKEIGNILILNNFNENLFKYYLNMSIGKGSECLKKHLIKNKKKLSGKKLDLIESLKI